jgi:hypothetical protein
MLNVDHLSPVFLVTTNTLKITPNVEYIWRGYRADIVPESRPPYERHEDDCS